MKRCYRYRCSRKACQQRRTLRHAPDWYIRMPRCRACGSRLRWDRYRDRVELDRQLCRCDRAPYPHRRGSAAYGGRYGPWMCEHAPVPF